MGTSSSPSGHLDEVTIVDGGVKVRGWAYDPDAPDGRLTVGVYVDQKLVDVISTGAKRPDVTAVFGRGATAGFDATVKVAGVAPGTLVCASAANVGPGTNSLLGCRTAADGVPAESKPTDPLKPTEPQKPTEPPPSAPTTAPTTTVPDPCASARSTDLIAQWGC